MVFPGVTNASQLPYEYDCSSSLAPAIATYAASPVYQIVPLSTDYRASDTAGLSVGSNLVKAAQQRERRHKAGRVASIPG